MVGLGVMGMPMAQNILKSGLDLSCCDVNWESLKSLKGLVPSLSSAPAKVAKNRNVAITMLPTSDVVEEVIFGDEGLICSLDPNSLIIDMSTASYKKSMEISARLAELGHRFVDAPVGRTPREAKTGDLLVMVGGNVDDIEQANAIFEAVGNTIIHAGPIGNGLKSKLVNNYMAMVNNAVTGETLSLANQVGLNIEATAKLMSSTAAGLGQLNTNYPKKVLANDLTPDFPISMAIKDLNMALELASSFKSKCLFGKLAKRMFQEAEVDGMGQLDQTAILKHLLGDKPKL
jgi:4-hydroxybutyrate dehydrogenase/sulfolactaldehyde 3-reductase